MQLVRRYIKASSRPNTVSALYAVPEGRPLTAKVTEEHGIQKDLGDLVHPAMPVNPILVGRRCASKNSVVDPYA